MKWYTVFAQGKVRKKVELHAAIYVYGDICSAIVLGEFV